MSHTELPAMEMMTVSEGTEIAGAKQSIRYTSHIKAFRTEGGRRREDMHNNTLDWKSGITKLHFAPMLQKLHLSLNTSGKR